MTIVQNKKLLIEVTGVAATAVASALIYTNKIIKTKKHTIYSKNTNLNILHLSDLHNCNFGLDNVNLIKKIMNSNPDVIIMTGDMIDAHYPNFAETVRFLNIIKTKCPCVYIEGNHESWADRNEIKGYSEFINKIKKNGIIVLRDEKYEIPDTNIVLYGLKHYSEEDILDEIDKDKYNIVLVHDPIHADDISEYEPNLILAGHTHGGQVNIPGIGGIFKHGYGKAAKYLSDKWNINKSTLIVNTGLGSSKIHLFRFRINVIPEIIEINIKKES